MKSKDKDSNNLLLNVLLSPEIIEDSGSTSTLPSYMIPATEAPEENVEEEEGGLEDALQVFKIFKLARVLKLARHSPGLQVGFIVNYTALTSLHLPGHSLHPEEQLQGVAAACVPHCCQRLHFCKFHLLHRNRPGFRLHLYTHRILLGGRHHDHSWLWRHFSSIR